MMSNVEFSNIEITKALYKAVEGCAEIKRISAQDFIHATLAFQIGEILSKEIEFIVLTGKSVEEDTELLRRYISLRKEGKLAVILNKFSYSDYENIEKAMDVVKKEFEALGENDMGKFDPLFKNVMHEQEGKMIGYEEISDDLTIEPEEIDRTRERRKEHRENKGYLVSEIPPQFMFGGIYGGIEDPSTMLQLQPILDIVSSMKKGDIDPKKPSENPLRATSRVVQAVYASSVFHRARRA